MQTRLQQREKEDKEYLRLRQTMDRHIGETELHIALNMANYGQAWDLIVRGEVEFEAFTADSHPYYPSSTALHCFARQAPRKLDQLGELNWDSFCKLLVEKSYNVINAVNAKQMPPLHLACQQGNVPLARALLRAKAGREQISSQNQTAPAPTEREEKIN